MGSVGVGQGVVLGAGDGGAEVGAHLGGLEVVDLVQLGARAAQEDGAERAALGGDAPVAPHLAELFAQGCLPLRPAGAAVGGGKNHLPRLPRDAAFGGPNGGSWVRSLPHPYSHHTQNPRIETLD